MRIVNQHNKESGDNLVKEVEMNSIETPSSRDRQACATGGCGFRGMCPGTALLLSLAAGYGLEWLTGLGWVLPVTATIGTIMLVAGWHRYLNPFRYLGSDKGNL